MQFAGGMCLLALLLLLVLLMLLLMLSLLATVLRQTTVAVYTVCRTVCLRRTLAHTHTLAHSRAHPHACLAALLVLAGVGGAICRGATSYAAAISWPVLPQNFLALMPKPQPHTPRCQQQQQLRRRRWQQEQCRQICVCTLAVHTRRMRYAICTRATGKQTQFDYL